jgi:hypothetical protein
MGHRPDSGFTYSSMRLIAPCGREAANVWSNRVWSTWDPDGTGGQNDKGQTLDDAKWCAEHAAKVWWYESGWASPTGGAT